MGTKNYQQGAEFLYVSNYGEGGLVMKDGSGNLFPLTENFSLQQQIYRLRDNSLLLLQDKSVTANAASRAKELGLDDLFRECVEDLTRKIDSAHITLH